MFLLYVFGKLYDIFHELCYDFLMRSTNHTLLKNHKVPQFFIDQYDKIRIKQKLFGTIWIFHSQKIVSQKIVKNLSKIKSSNIF